MNTYHRVIQFLKHAVTASSRYRIHSPFIYEFVTTVLKDNKKVKPCQDIELIRRELGKSSSILEVIDFGAGSGQKPYMIRKVKSKTLALKSGVSPKTGRLLFRMAEHYRPTTILELGTAFGFSTMYMASAPHKPMVHTIEGCATTAEKAAKNFLLLGLNNIKIWQGSFANILPVVLPQLTTIDLLFVDGDHRREATLNYFKQLLPLASGNSIFVFHDIHVSTGMSEAWYIIRANPRITASIDLYHAGICFFNPDLSKQHFTLDF